MHTAWIIGLSVLDAIGLGFLLIPQIIYWQIKHIKKVNSITNKN